MLGLGEDFVPRFAKPYARLWQEATAATASYIKEVRERTFPAPQHWYGNKKG
jgi:3-methyl-2-oxobutanoate hydroxymethyltransferase